MVSQSNFSLNILSIAGGHAEPPTTFRFRLSKVVPVCSAALISPCQMVGTPKATDTLKVSIKCTKLAPSSPGPGKTKVQPTIAAAYGVPHALTWNIGTTGSIISRAEIFNESGIQMA